MSDAHSHHDDSSPHEGPIKTPKQLIIAVFFSFLIPIIAIILLATYVTADKRPAAGSDGMGAEAVAQRIQPVGRVVVKDPTDLASMKTGEQVYAAQCAACHTAGVAGAPKLGDQSAWAARIATGYEALLTAALKGKGAMAAQGGGDHSDLEIGRAVVYMANKAGANFADPKPPTATTAAAPAAAETTAPATAAAPAAPATPAPTAAPAAAETKTAAAAAPPPLYGQVCAACHVAGVAGAPKLGDKAAWAPRLAAGIDGLTASVIKGKGAMPPRGGSTATDAEIKSLVEYMVSTVK
ncbi:c-type cytochrome [Piscinibacter sakaiensis]|uniref:c-type cytochrome n=1 Tax=Piscinibacter sakaiensis TaxID=1547922 RepID=UPI003AAD815C